MYNIDYAHRYLKGLTTAGIAQLIREQIVEEVIAGELPALTYEVVEDQNGNDHIEVTIKSYTGEVFNKRAVELDEELAQGPEVLGAVYKTLLYERLLLPLFDLDLDLVLKAVSRLANQWLYEDGPVEHVIYTCNVFLDPDIVVAALAEITPNNQRSYLMKVNKVVVKSTKGKKYKILHDQEITPPREDKQILAALKQQYDVLSFTIENGVANALVGKHETQ